MTLVAGPAQPAGRRGAASTLLLVRLAQERGIPAQQALRGTGLTLADLRRPGAEVTVEQELCAVLAVLTADAVRPEGPDLAVVAGGRYHLTTYGIWGFALAASATVREALQVGLRFVDLSFAFCRLTVEQDEEEVRLVLDGSALDEPLRRYAITRDLVALATLAGELTAGQLPISRLEVALEALPTGWPDALRQARPGAARTVLALTPEALDLPLPQADELTAATTLAQCRELLEQRRSRTGLAARLRDLLAERAQQMPSQAQAAASLAMSQRTLRRRLEHEQTSYRALADEVRETLAVELLAAGLGVGQVASRLGYAETASFTHAFTRWRGVPPSRLQH